MGSRGSDPDRRLRAARALDTLYAGCCLLGCAGAVIGMPFIAAQEGLAAALLVGLLALGLLVLSLGFVVPGARGLHAVGVGSAVLAPLLALVALVCLIAPAPDAVGLLVFAYAAVFAALAFALLRRGGPEGHMTDGPR